MYDLSPSMFPSLSVAFADDPTVRWYEYRYNDLTLPGRARVGVYPPK